jgi:hypothetical protein
MLTFWRETSVSLLLYMKNYIHDSFLLTILTLVHLFLKNYAVDLTTQHCSQIASVSVFPHYKAQVSYPYKTEGKVIVLYILISTFLYSRVEDQRV